MRMGLITCTAAIVLLLSLPVVDALAQDPQTPEEERQEREEEAAKKAREDWEKQHPADEPPEVFQPGPVETVVSGVVRVLFFTAFGALAGGYISTQVTDMDCEMCGLNVLAGMAYGGIAGLVTGIVVVSLDGRSSDPEKQDGDSNADEESSNHISFNAAAPPGHAPPQRLRVFAGSWRDANAEAVFGLAVQGAF